MRNPRYKHYPKNASPSTFGPEPLVRDLVAELDRLQDGAMYKRVANFMSKLWPKMYCRMTFSSQEDQLAERHAYVKNALRNTKFSEPIKLLLWDIYTQLLFEQEQRVKAAATRAASRWN